MRGRQRDLHYSSFVVFCPGIKYKYSTDILLVVLSWKGFAAANMVFSSCDTADAASRFVFLSGCAAVDQPFSFTCCSPQLVSGLLDFAYDQLFGAALIVSGEGGASS